MTTLAPAVVTETTATRVWSWPIDTTHRRQSVLLTEAEFEGTQVLGCAFLGRARGETVELSVAQWSVVGRLLRPLDDVRAALHWEPGTEPRRRFARDAAALVLMRCGELQRAFWGWSEQDWIDLIDPSGEHFKQTWPGQIGSNVRPYVLAYAYLLSGFTAFGHIGRFHRPGLAWRVFGRDRVDDAVGQIREVLGGWGYRGRDQPMTASVCQMLLVNRSPLLEDLSTETLERMRADSSMGGWFYGIHRAVAALGYADPPSPPHHGDGPAVIEGTAPGWAEWVERWYSTSTLIPTTRNGYRSVLSKIGRWLAAEHPGITEPGQWTRETCASWIAAVDRMAVGDHVQWQDGTKAREGDPLSAETKSGYLGMARTFFRDCQEWEWIPRRFNVATALRTPRSVNALLGPDPRVIADDIWAKLLWAGLNLDLDDLPTGDGRTHPIELIRAITLTWLFSGQRSDEITRLRVGCVRWQHDGMPIPGDSAEILAPDAVCLLDVPTHKTGTAFTKPVDPLLGQALEAWQAVRPEQPKMLDRKTRDHVDFLFAFRASRVSKHYINQTIIPMLCGKAGVPAADVRGNITSHRARSTIASQLYNAKEPMTLFELQAWLGHRELSSTQHYAKITPNTLSKAYHDAGYFERNLRTIEVLIDRDAVASGAATTGEPWQHYDLGHGYCTYTFFEQCPHRMACAKCNFYTPKSSSKAQMLEAKDNLQRMLANIPLSDDERAAIDDGHAALNQLLGRLADVPTPAGPTPRQIGVPTAATLLPIVNVRHMPAATRDTPMNPPGSPAATAELNP